jgi:gas vesicle protein
MKGGRVREQSQVIAGALIGALVGAAAAYLFLTEGGRGLRDKFEPAMEDLQREFTRFRGTIEQFGHLASDGMRVMDEFRAARGNTPYSEPGTSH